MRVLLDECLPKRLKRSLVGHDIQTVPEAGRTGEMNGELIRPEAAIAYEKEPRKTLQPLADAFRSSES